MTQFKVGDRVRRRAGHGFDGLPADKVFKVQDVRTRGPNDQSIEINHRPYDPKDGWWGASAFELVSKPSRDYVADHARRTLRKAGFSKEHAALFVRDVQRKDDYEPYPDPLTSIDAVRGEDGYVDLSKLSRSTHGRTPRDLIMGAWRWNSMHGKNFADWDNIYSEYQ